VEVYTKRKRVIILKIWGEVPRIPGIYDKNMKASKIGKTAGTVSKKDVLSISNTAKDYQTVIKALKDVPDIRQDKINKLIEDYQSGSYDVSGKDIAERIVKSIIDKKV
jgi:negative regulator of flagellin synthesis FlgM